jgi:hypothetical protein
MGTGPYQRVSPPPSSPWGLESALDTAVLSTISTGSRLTRRAGSDALLRYVRPARRPFTGQSRRTVGICGPVVDQPPIGRELAHGYADECPASGVDHTSACRSRAAIRQLHRPFLRALAGHLLRPKKHLERAKVSWGMARPINQRGRVIAASRRNHPQIMAGAVTSREEQHRGQSDRD